MATMAESLSGADFKLYNLMIGCMITERNMYVQRDASNVFFHIMLGRSFSLLLYPRWWLCSWAPVGSMSTWNWFLLYAFSLNSCLINSCLLLCYNQCFKTVMAN
uniref:Uncharacterized protein n=1 Tax=Pyxicephalus adspersus TaxID=30357 RepID=A0AAV3B2K3_PYXAD|nr:TPA: hypothetical protein GDO54_007540 [Pyxicephalus adspersus]